ncbi:MAG: hypothetical protein AB8B85_09380 [Paracoccaceae bacterium]
MADLSDHAHELSAHRAAEVRQYSRTVRWMKVLLPVGAVVLIILIFLSGKTRDAVVATENSMNAAALGAGLKLENPRFAGMTDSGEPFVVTAVSALPDGAMPDLVELDRPSGEMKMSDGRTLNATSAEGQFYRISERLVLEGAVRLVTSDGYLVETERVDVDLAGRTAIAPNAFSATGPAGTLKADGARMETSDAEKAVVLRFEGNVKVTFDPKKAE